MTLEEDEKSDDIEEVGHDDCSAEKRALEASHVGNVRTREDKSRARDKKGNESNECPFETIDNAASTMKKLET